MVPAQDHRCRGEKNSRLFVVAASGEAYRMSEDPSRRVNQTRRKSNCVIWRAFKEPIPVEEAHGINFLHAARDYHKAIQQP